MSAQRNERREEQHPIEGLVKEVEFKQRNTTWPDAMVNAKDVDELLWKGSQRITKVQRVGIALLGLAFILCGVLFIGDFGSQSNSRWLPIFFGIGCILVGCKFLWNSIRKNDAPKANTRK
jgi:hypothetical protein